MNALWCLLAVISCLMVVVEPRTPNLPKKEPPLETSHPDFWKTEAKSREFVFANKNNWHIDISREGHVSGSHRRRESAVILRVSGENQTVALKGKLAGKFLCVNSTWEVYASDHLNKRDCYFEEKYNDNNYNSYRHTFHRRGNTAFFLSINSDGTITLTNGSSMSIYFLTLNAKETSLKNRKRVTSSTTILPSATSVATLATPTVPPYKIELEKTRKRRRRWCKYLLKGKLQKNPTKYKKRCKYDCDILERMLNSVKRYQRKCEKQRRKRRLRNASKRRSGRRRDRPIRHHHGEGRRRTRKHRRRGHKHKRKSVVTNSPQTHNTDVT